MPKLLTPPCKSLDSLSKINFFIHHFIYGSHSLMYRICLGLILINKIINTHVIFLNFYIKRPKQKSIQPFFITDFNDCPINSGHFFCQIFFLVTIVPKNTDDIGTSEIRWLDAISASLSRAHPPKVRWGLHPAIVVAIL